MGEQGLTSANPMKESSVIPLIPLEMYGLRVRWMLENPGASIGRYVSSAPFLTTFPEIAAAFQNVNNVPTRFQPIATREWMEGASTNLNVDDTLPRGWSKDDPTTFTFRRKFLFLVEFMAG